LTPDRISVVAGHRRFVGVQLLFRQPVSLAVSFCVPGVIYHTALIMADSLTTAIDPEPQGIVGQSLATMYETA